MLRKVFAIGLPRAGTTSLHSLFIALGFKSRHLDMDLINGIGAGRCNFANINNHEAFSDSPYPFLWKDLFYLFPSAKFILHTRPEEDWLRSIEKLSSFNKRNGSWDDRPKNSAHRSYLAMLFGSPDFDREVWRAGYRRHHLTIRKFFENQASWKFLDIQMVPERNEENAYIVADFLGVQAPKGLIMPMRNKGEVENIGKL